MILSFFKSFLLFCFYTVQQTPQIIFLLKKKTSKIMNKIFELTERIGAEYVLFILVLILANSIAKVLFDEKPNSTKKIVITVSVVIFLTFWVCGARFVSLFLYLFFAFGLYDFFGRHIEKLLLHVFFIIANWVAKKWKVMKTKKPFSWFIG